MAADVKAIEAILRKDKEARLSVSEWIVQLARKIKENPEDVVWFFNEMKRRREWEEKLKEFEKITNDISLEELFEIAVKEAESSGGVEGDVENLLAEVRNDLRKFQRIEAKLKRLGVI